MADDDSSLPNLVVPLVAIAAVGLVTAAKGVVDMASSRSIARQARGLHEDALQDLQIAVSPVHDRVVEYGQQQIDAVAEVLGRFADWIELNQMAVNRLGHDPVGGVDVRVAELPTMKNEVTQARTWIKGGIAGAGAAAAAPQAALIGVTSFATAGTGTAISSLSGAAATNATMAWLGGGPIAAGGGGMAAGSAVLTLVAAAPAAFVGGITVAVIGSKQKTSARQYAADVSVACLHIATAVDLMPRIIERVDELSDVLAGLVARAETAIGILEAVEFDADSHAPEFALALQLVRAIREVVNTPVLDEDTGALTEVSLTIVRKYQ